MTSFFTTQDHLALIDARMNGIAETGLQRVHNRMVQLHKALFPRLRQHGMDLHLCATSSQNPVNFDTATSPSRGENMTIAYSRSHNQALVVEGIMGRDPRNTDDAITLSRHPVIEVRITPHGLTVELVVAPTAWHDQQNLAGKLSVHEHRESFHRLLKNCTSDCIVGFWGGTHLDEMHFSTEQLPPAYILAEWMDTFAAGRDWLRIGMWYETEDAALSEQRIVEEVFQRMRELYDLYSFISWNGNNDFINFYRRAVGAARR
jgi:hypothetical protein